MHRLAYDVPQELPGHLAMLPDYRIDEEILRLYPGYRRGLVLGQALRNGPSKASLLEELRAQESVLRADIQGNPAEHPRIGAWRKSYRRFGARPSEFRSSIEALARRVLRGDSLPNINALVDIGNLRSMRYLIQVVGHPHHSKRWMRNRITVAPRGSSSPARRLPVA